MILTHAGGIGIADLVEFAVASGCLTGALGFLNFRVAVSFSRFCRRFPHNPDPE